MATNGHSGYPLKWFKDQNLARNSFECAICLEVLEDPVQVRDCGHQFCALCIDEILRVDPRCPTCRIGISKAMVFEDHAARRLIKKLDVNCNNEGCRWAGNLSCLLETHMNSCNFKIRDESRSSVQKSDVEKLEKKLHDLQIEVSALKKLHEKEMREVKIKHESDMKEVKVEEKELREQIAFLANFALPPTRLQSLGHLMRNPLVTVAMKVPNVFRKLNQAKSNNVLGKITGDPFYTSHGYRMKVMLHLNEGPRGYTGYIGIYIILVPGDHDDSLKWPFDKRVTFIAVDQQDDERHVCNLEKTLNPRGENEFTRPFVEKGGRGFHFMLHSTLGQRQYVKGQSVCIAVAIDP